MQMTPCQKIKREILLGVLDGLQEDYKYADDEEKTFIKSLESGITADSIEEQYARFVAMDMHWDHESAFREGDVETKLPCDWSRHYESKAVARKLSDGSWVGWTYWYGGGKHGEPEAVPWMEDAYNVVLTETEKLVVVQEFKKVND